MTERQLPDVIDLQTRMILAVIYGTTFLWAPGSSGVGRAKLKPNLTLREAIELIADPFTDDEGHYAFLDEKAKEWLQASENMTANEIAEKWPYLIRAYYQWDYFKTWDAVHDPYSPRFYESLNKHFNVKLENSKEPPEVVTRIKRRNSDGG